MGIETTKALQARRRESAAQIERLIARAHERNPIGSARRARIKQTAGLARRKVRALRAAQESVTAIELELGQALLRLLDQGMSRNEAFELVGLSRHVGRRHLDLVISSPPPRPTAFSTELSGDRATGRAETDLDLDGGHPGAAMPGREL
jgi:hypothetical protein